MAGGERELLVAGFGTTFVVGTTVYSSSLSDKLLAIKNLGLFGSVAGAGSDFSGSGGGRRREIDGFSGVKPRTMLLDTRCRLLADMLLETGLPEPCDSDIRRERGLGMSVGTAGAAVGTSTSLASSVASGLGSLSRLLVAFWAFHFSSSVFGGSSDSIRLLNESVEKCLTLCRRDDDSRRLRPGCAFACDSVSETAEVVS